MLTTLILEIISQYLHVSKYHMVHLKLTLREMSVKAGDGASQLDAVAWASSHSIGPNAPQWLLGLASPRFILH